jgi:signal transduction histidine kinase
MTQFTFTLVASVGIGMLGVLLLRLLPTLRLQLAGLALLAVALPLVTVLLSGLVMFHMHADFKVLVLSCGAAASVLFCAFILTRSIGRRVDELRRAAQELSSGNLHARAPTRGPSELAELATAFNEMAANIDRLFDSRRQLVAAASHDLRTPIAAIEAMHEAIEDGIVDVAHYLPALREQAHALRVLVDALFELARIDAGSMKMKLQVASLEEVLDGSLRAIEVEAITRDIDLHTDFDPTMPEVFCAPDQIKRVLANLLTNAIRVTPAGGSILLRTEARDHEVHILVEDDGTGLSRAAQERMFERFWRDDPARSSRENSGLGLAIAKGLVEAHGGKIWAENRSEGGARVAFSLPAATAVLAHV